MTRTTCPYCGVGCGVMVRAGQTLSVEGDPHHPANAGRLCSKGSALAETLGVSGRLLHPRVRGRQVGWPEALATAAGGFAAAVREHGPDAVAFYVSGQLLTEDYYLANKLMKGFIGGANIDTNSRLCMASAVAGQRRAFGEDLVPGCYEDLGLADLIVLAGANTAWCHPILFRRIEQEKQRRPALKLVVIDPRRTPTAAFADLHLPVRAGSDVALFNGLLGHLHRSGAADAEFVSRHTAGADAAIEAALRAGDAAEVARTCGCDPRLILEFYESFRTTERVVTAFSQGINQSTAGTDKVNSIINCHLLTGRIGRPGMGPFSLTGQPNAMGGREVGGLANSLAAHLDLESPDHRVAVQRFWNSPRIAARAGLKAVELFEALHGGRIKAVWIMATNPVVSLPDADRVRDALRRCAHVVVSDCVADTDTASLAHVLLPAAAWGEKDGTVTNSERRICRQRRFVDPPGEARPDWWIIAEMARRMGFGRAFPYTAPHQIFDEHARLSALAAGFGRSFDISGLTGLSEAQYEALEPTQWPVPARGGGEARLFVDGRFAHTDGRARFVPLSVRPPAHATDEAYPLVLNTGRIRDQWHTMTRTGRSARLTEHLPEPFVDLHPHDALLASVREGELAAVSTSRGSLVARVRLSGEIPHGMMFVPIHWSDANASEARVGALVNADVDPHSGEPEFKHTPARIVPFPVDWYGVIFARGLIRADDIAWWTLVRGGVLRYELAGRGMPADWPGWWRQRLGEIDSDADILEYSDVAAGIYRTARVRDGRLESCGYFSRRHELPGRAWVTSMFEKSRLESSDRTALLAGRALRAADEEGILVCSCARVGRSTLQRVIEREGLRDTRQIGERLGAGVNCGSCLPEIRALLAEAAAAS